MCFSMKLILVVDNMDMINARCYHFVESYCQLILLKKILLKLLLSTVVTAKCTCIRNTNVCFSNVCMQHKLVNILSYVLILSYKNGVTIP